MNDVEALRPRSALERTLPVFAVFRASTKTSLQHDLIAGLTVALFTVPQSMAYALIAGLPPSTGIWSAVFASILGALFGSSEFLINGPTNAMSVLLAANMALFTARGDPVAMVVITTLMIGAIQLATAALELGRFTRFVSEPVLTGFTAGAGLYIAINQLPSVLGLSKTSLVQTLGTWKPPASVLFDLARITLSLDRTNLYALAVGASTFLLVRVLQWSEKRFHYRRVPAPFVAVVLVSLVTYALGLGDAHHIKLVRDIEPIARVLPKPFVPAFTGEDLSALLTPALAIGLLGSVEAIAIGKVLASKAGHAFDANKQLIGEGLCNVGAALAGGFASSGSFTRTMVNFESGAITRLSAIFSGLLVLLLVLAFAPAANHIPIAALAGTLMHIGLKLVNVSRLQVAALATRGDRTVLATTFLGVLLTEHLQYALFAGIAVSIIQALRRAEGFKLVELVRDDRGALIERPISEHEVRDIIALDLQGELFFAAADVLETRLTDLLQRGTRFMVLRLAQAYNLDFTTAAAIENVGRAARKRGGRLLLSGVRPGTYGTLERAGVVESLGREAVFQFEHEVTASTNHALALARKLAAESAEPGAGALRDAASGP